MVMKTETINNSGVVDFSTRTGHEHHKIDLIVTEFSSNISLRIEDVSNITNTPINLDSLDRTFILTENGGEGYVLENMRLDKIRVNIISGGGKIVVNYTGW